MDIKVQTDKINIEARIDIEHMNELQQEAIKSYILGGIYALKADIATIEEAPHLLREFCKIDIVATKLKEDIFNKGGL